jgi:hypothetical protein
MIQKLNRRGYYVMATRQTAYPPSWRWRIVRRGEPMGVQIEGGGFSSYHAARLAGGRALADFLEQLELEETGRVDDRPSKRQSAQGKPTIARAASWRSCLAWPCRWLAA